MNITEDNLEEAIQQTDEPDALKELMAYAIKFNRDDLIEMILDKSIQINRLLDKLQNLT